MAKIFFTSNYYKNPARANTGKLLRYIGTRESVEKLPTGIDRSPSTVRQQRLIADIVKSFPHSKKYAEYEKFQNASTKSNATNFIDAVIEREDIRRLDKLMTYIAERPGVQKLGAHGLFSQTDDAIDLDVAANEVNSNGGIDRKIGGTNAQMPVIEKTPKADIKTQNRPKFKATEPKTRKAGTGCLYQISENLWEGSFSPTLANGKRKKFNIYAKTREECETALAQMIEQKKSEITAEKERLKAEQEA